MWTCPKCGREFKNTRQDHYCGEPENSILAYIASQPEEIQPLLMQVRETLRDVLPDAEERISWRMPTYWKRHNIIHFAAFKHHIGIYPGGEALTHFTDRLAGYKTSKGALQLPLAKPLPLDLVRDIAIWCREANERS